MVRHFLVALTLAGCTAAASPSTDAGPDAAPEPTACVPRKPAPNGGQYYTFSALPSGACSTKVDCRLGVYGPCWGDPEYVGYPYNGYRCTCASGAWSCSIEFAGLSICGGDGGGPDAAHD
jgi:hypothetical protein